jgi:hypothetical protein
MNFKNIGANTAQESSAFKKIRMHSKLYNTNLVHTPTTFTNKYTKLNSLYTNENSLYDSLNYGLKRQHNLTSTAATTSTYSTFLDRNSMDRFLTSNLQYNTDRNTTDMFTNNLNSFSKKQVNNLNLINLNKLNVLMEHNNEFNSKGFKNLLTHPNLIIELNDDSDKPTIKLPIRKLLAVPLIKNELINIVSVSNSTNHNYTTSNISNLIENSLNNKSITTKLFKTASESQGILPADQSVRKYSKLQANNTNFNLSLGLNSIDSNLKALNNNVVDSLFKTHTNVKSNWIDFSVSQKLANNSFFFEAPFSPILSNNPYLLPLDYDTTTSKTITTNSINNKVYLNVEKRSSESISLLSGRRDNVIKTLGASY